MRNTLFCLPVLLAFACEAPPPDLTGLTAVASCVYVNAFSESEECREYLGANWDLNRAEEDCSLQEDALFSVGGCDYEDVLGDCVFAAGTDDVYKVRLPGSDEEACSGNEVGCEVFGGGQFVAAEPCGGLPDRDLQQGLVFINPEQMCVEEVCAWNSISGCTEEGLEFTDYGSCEDVRSQRGYYPVPENEFETAPDDPILQDESYLAESAWVKQQVKACGCVCCHDTSTTTDGGSNWIIDSDKPTWTDGFNPSGLAFAAGWVDSSLLGAYPAEVNNGFGRDRAGIPSTDQDRLIAFFEGEAQRRGMSREDYADAEPVPFVFYNQATYEPEACEDGEGVARDGTVTWRRHEARYIYVLDEGSDNPGTPPNLDQPEGTRWLLEVYWDEDPMASGLRYPTGPARASQRVEGAPLVDGTRYYLYVLADVGLPITRCLFTY